MLCIKCKENLAVVFVTKVESDGKHTNEGYCLSCARDLNIQPLDDIIKKIGVDPEEMDSLNREMTKLLSGEDGDGLDEENVMNFIKDALGDEAAADTESNADGNENNKDFKNNPFAFIGSMLNGLKKSEDEDEDHKSNENVSKGHAQVKAKTKSKPNKRKYLDTYGVNLTEKARNNEIDAVIGRTVEIERVIQILNRRTKNNPCLIGEPGVGKTAIAEGLALKIVEGAVPAKLLTYEIYLLDLTSVVAGTQFRGQFESRLKNIIEETKKLGNIILVIDEVHTLVSAGDAEGAMSAGNILKPALARGDIQVIGATTINEYRKYIEKDSALERRFQAVMIDEPTIEETINILKNIKSYYENYHKVKISDDVIKNAVVLSERYISDRFMPDKAIDVIDEAASKVNLSDNTLVSLEKLKIELKSVQEEKENAATADSIEDYQKAADLKIRECKLLEDIESITKNRTEINVTIEDVASVIEAWTKIPVKQINEFETNKLINLEERIHEGFIGQDEAVEAVARAIRRRRAGISLKRRPVSFIFVGPTGVGKTELVKQISRVVYNGEDSLIRLDMSEFMERHSASKLIGSPPGYVGYDDAGQLTEKVRRRPYSVILLDEIEKAHPDIFNMLLQILDDGNITDSHGKLISFENTIIIMTSNAGSDQKANIAGFTGSTGISSHLKIDRAIKEIFRPEFLNRVDEVIEFKELTKEEMLKIIDLMLSDIVLGLKEKGIGFRATDEAKEAILSNSYNSIYGARPMRRYIQRHAEDAVAQMIITEEIKTSDEVELYVHNGELKVRVIV